MALQLAQSEINLILLIVIIGVIIGILLSWISHKIISFFRSRKLKNARMMYENMTKKGFKFIDGVKEDDENSKKIDISVILDEKTGKEVLNIKEGEEIKVPFIIPKTKLNLGEKKMKMERSKKEVINDKKIIKPEIKKRLPFDLSKLKR